MYKKIEKCRICGNTHLEPVLDLGEQVLTGVFPADKNANITKGPLRLVKCHGSEDVCGLLQLEHSYDFEEMYGENYGYRSGLNISMVAHLHKKVERIVQMVNLREGDLIIDIGSNDSTTLQGYPSLGLNLVGIDPTGVKFKKYYPSHVKLLPEFYSSEIVKEHFPGKKAKVITSFSMFYDLESPMHFMEQIYDVLSDDGVWVFEQSYMPTMLNMNSYDTVCHEHLEYYTLRQIKWMCERVGFSIIDIEFNAINGGSFSIAVRKAVDGVCHSPLVDKVMCAEVAFDLDSLKPYNEFAKRVELSKNKMNEFIAQAQSKGKKIYGLGASTKGNVILQYCDLTENEIQFIGEVNPEKYGHFTPGSHIPIIAEDDLLKKSPDYLIVLPWHFKEYFLKVKKYSRTTLVFPLPEIDICDQKSEETLNKSHFMP